jgi:F-type H+-transporting ATPase subunit a
MHEGIHIALKAEVLGHLFGVPITNTMLMSWLVIAVLVGLAFTVGRNLTKIPGRLQTFFEALFSFLIDYIEQVLESRTLALRFLPLLATLFLFILLGNWFGLVPGIGSVTVEPSVHAEESIPANPLHAPTTVEATEPHRVSLFYPISVDLNVTLALALIVFVVIEGAGMYFLGFFRYMGKFINFHSPIGFFVGLIELVSELARLISFSFRLFGNMFAGKTLIVVAFAFIPLILPVPLMLYEVLVGFIQASIFTLLTLFFIKLAVSEVH